MIRVIGVRFRNVGKIYYFSPKDLDIKAGDHVIVETARGVEYVNVVLAPRYVEDETVVHAFNDVISIDNAQDGNNDLLNRYNEIGASKICHEEFHVHNVDIKHSDV